MTHAKKMIGMFLVVQVVCAVSTMGAPYNPVTYNYTVPYTANANTVALYHLDEGSGITAADSSTNGNTMSIPDDGSTTWMSGTDPIRFGASAVQSPATSLAAPDSTSFDSLTNAMTAEAWFYLNTDYTLGVNSYRGLISKTIWADVLNSGFTVALRGDGVAISESCRVLFRISDRYFHANTGGLAAGEWHHIAAVLDPEGSGTAGEAGEGGMYLYLDGELISQKGTAFKTITANDHDFVINAIPGMGVALGITLDEVRVSNVAMAPIPEPATMSLIGLGGIAVLLRKRVQK